MADIMEEMQIVDPDWDCMESKPNINSLSVQVK